MADERGVTTKINEAREEMAAGKFRAAVGTLGDVASATRDPDLLREMHGMGEEGLAASGRFGKGAWKQLLHELDEQMESVGVVNDRVGVSS